MSIEQQTEKKTTVTTQPTETTQPENPTKPTEPSQLKEPTPAPTTTPTTESMSTTEPTITTEPSNLLDKYITVPPFDRPLFLSLTSAIAIWRLRGYNEGIQQVEKKTDIAKHLLFIEFNLLLAVLIGFIITPVCSWIKRKLANLAAGLSCLFNKFCVLLTSALAAGLLWLFNKFCVLLTSAPAAGLLWLNKFCKKNSKVEHEEQERTKPNPLPQHTQEEKASDKQLKTSTTNPKQDQNKK